MTLSLTDKMKTKVKTLLSNCLHRYQISTRKLTITLGNIIASIAVVTVRPLHYTDI